METPHLNLFQDSNGSKLVIRLQRWLVFVWRRLYFVPMTLTCKCTKQNSKFLELTVMFWLKYKLVFETHLFEHCKSEQFHWISFPYLYFFLLKSIWDKWTSSIANVISMKLPTPNRKGVNSRPSRLKQNRWHWLNCKAGGKNELESSLGNNSSECSTGRS